MRTALLASALILAAAVVPEAEAMKRKAESDPRDLALAALIAEASAAITTAAQGGEVDPAWTWETDAFGIGTTEPAVAQQLAELGGEPEIVMTVLEIEGAAGDATGPGYLRGSAVVFPNGTVRWLAPSFRAENPALGPTSGLAEAAPALVGAAARQAEALAGPACDLALLTPAEVAHIPATLASQLPMDPVKLQRTCEEVAPRGIVWKPKVDDITVLVRVGEHHVALRSSFVVDGDRLLLDAVRIQAVE
jgi:hypothetical protein